MGHTKTKAAVGAGVSLVGGLVGAVMPADVASAHDAVATEGQDIARVSADHLWIRVVDVECDGHFSRGWFNYANLTQERWTVPDCGDSGWFPVPPGTYVTSFRMCEQDIGCGSWKDA